MSIVEDIRKEVAFAEERFPPFNSFHEGYTIIAHELDELWELVKAQSLDYKQEYHEAKQIACNAIRFMKLCQKKDMELK